MRGIHSDCLRFIRGLDNAGKTTIVKKFNDEPIDTISPTLGFNIQTLEYKSYAPLSQHVSRLFVLTRLL